MFHSNIVRIVRECRYEPFKLGVVGYRLDEWEIVTYTYLTPGRRSEHIIPHFNVWDDREFYDAK